jgi:UDP-GlcNAc:undecaprenyl-phosphate/decaprenyl-phosphate GlcNAc-1-phosphate transferase
VTAAAGVLAGLVCLLLVGPLRRGRRLPGRENYRGRRVPVVLGIAVTAAIIPCLFLAMREVRAVWIAGATLVVFAAGLYDDVQPGRVGGLLTHGRALLRGTMTSGIVKLLAALAGGAIVVLGTGPEPARGLLGVAVMAGSANLVNLLDVRPGRALKLFIPAAASLCLPAVGAAPLIAPALGAGVAALPFDLRERAMLGDSGSNVLGFVAGVGLYAILGVFGLAVSLAVVVALHVVSEAVSFSRIIRSVAVLRWLDHVGRPPRGHSRVS